MGHTRVIYTDATTAEAATVLKANGFQEGNQGGCYLSPNSPIKAYIVWGKCRYYPSIEALLDFSPRVQIHLKSREEQPLCDLTVATSAGLKNLASGTRVRVFDTVAAQEIDC